MRRIAMAATVLALGACVTGTTDHETAHALLEAQGYSEIVLGQDVTLATGCPYGSGINPTTFVAKAVNGATVTGKVCQPYYSNSGHSIVIDSVRKP